MKRIISTLLCVFLTLGCISVGACKSNQGQVNITYKDAQTIMQLLCDDGLDYGLLSEPAATTLEKVKGKNYTWKRLSLQKLYDSNTESYPQAVLMVKEEILNSYPQLVREIGAKFNDNVNWVKNNPTLAVNAVKSNYEGTSLNPDVIDSAVVDNCKISWQDAISAKDSINEYISNILSVNQSQIVAPAKVVDDSFFYNDNLSQGQAIENKTFSFYAPDGAPALAIAKFIYDNQSFISGATFNYNVVVADNIAKYTNGVLGLADFIVLPVNAASKNYQNQQAKYKMVSVITHGNIFIMAKVKEGDNSISLKQLNGKTIGVIGQGLVPDLTFKTVLSKNLMGYNVIG